MCAETRARGDDGVKPEKSCRPFDTPGPHPTPNEIVGSGMGYCILVILDFLIT